MTCLRSAAIKRASVILEQIDNAVHAIHSGAAKSTITGTGTDIVVVVNHNAGHGEMMEAVSLLERARTKVIEAATASLHAPRFHVSKMEGVV